MLFCVDYLSHPTTFSTTFDSKPSWLLCVFVGHLYQTIWKKSLFAATITKISYGIDVQESDDPYISRAEDSLVGVNQAASLGAFWVDFFPILKYVPRWFPGAGFQRKAARWREVNAIMVEKPFRYVEEQLVGDHHDLFESSWVHTNIFQQKGKAVPSVAASLIERLPDENDPQRPMEEKLARDVAAVSYAGVCLCRLITRTIHLLFYIRRRWYRKWNE